MQLKINEKLQPRLDKIISVVTTDEFLQRKGLGNEIPFHIFDYPAEFELQVRAHIDILKGKLQTQKPDLKFIHLDLYHEMIDHIRERGLLEKSFEMEKNKGFEQLKKAIAPSFKAENFVNKVIKKKIDGENHGLILMSGVGSAWPWIRAHSLLSNLQSVTGDTPLILFYPGVYDNRSMSLFGKLSSDNYYRAFRLIPDQ